MTSLFQIAAEYRSDIAKLEDLDLDDVALADTLESLGGELEVKAANVAKFVRNLEAAAEAIKGAEKAMSERRKAYEARAEAVKRYIKEAMELAGVSKIESPFILLTIKKTPPRVDVFEPDLVPLTYMRVAPPPPPELSKSAIAEDLKAGKDVQGARLVSGTRLEIK